LFVIVGALDLEFLDFDFDIDGVESPGLLSSLALFLNIGKVPSGLVLSVLSLNFWILTMLMYLLSIDMTKPTSLAVLLVTFVGAVFITKVEMMPLRLVFKDFMREKEEVHDVLTKECELLCDLEAERLGQVKVYRRGAAIVLNVKVEFEDEKFVKSETAMISRKDMEKNLYYIRKING
jgi:RNAse (barnase) inhibitor barstar